MKFESACNKKACFFQEGRTCRSRGDSLSHLLIDLVTSHILFSVVRLLLQAISNKSCLPCNVLSVGTALLTLSCRPSLVQRCILILFYILCRQFYRAVLHFLPFVPFSVSHCFPSVLIFLICSHPYFIPVFIIC